MAQQPPQTNHQELGHGNTPAAWTGVAVLMLAAALICLGIVFAQPFLWVPGVILVPVGALVWAGMNKAGYNTERRH